MWAPPTGRCLPRLMGVHEWSLLPVVDRFASEDPAILTGDGEGGVGSQIPCHIADLLAAAMPDVTPSVIGLPSHPGVIFSSLGW